MRGRTLNDAIVILDEAQNTTKAQMKMFLTRMGKNTQLVINGDVTQIDLIRKEDSGLMQATKRNSWNCHHEFTCQRCYSPSFGTKNHRTLFRD